MVESGLRALVGGRGREGRGLSANRSPVRTLEGQVDAVLKLPNQRLSRGDLPQRDLGDLSRCPALFICS